MEENIIKQVSNELDISIKQVEAVLSLLEMGNTVPFIARYRKEKTGALNEDQIREVSKVYEYGINLKKRQEDIIRLIDEKGMLNDELKTDILKCTKLSELEDIYRPFKEKKKTRAIIAKNKGLEPFSHWLLSLPRNGSVIEEAKKYLNDEVTSEEEAILGAQDIIAENMSETVKYRKYVKDMLYKTGLIVTKEKKKHNDENKIYEMYYNHSERLKNIVSHRILAINRAEKEKVVSVTFEFDKQRFLDYINFGYIKNKETTAKTVIEQAIEDGFKRLLYPSIEREIRSELTEKAETQALSVFSINLEKLLMQAPLKDKIILGVDPAYRTGCKLAVIDVTGKVLAIDKIYPTLPKDDYSKDIDKLLKLISKYKIEVVAIGNGTASRETEAFVSKVIKENHLNLSYVIVSEAGASVYSASKIAKEEFPDYQVEERSAVSIARRIQDPLAELVKIEPKAISVGQYQHDMNQKRLTEQLEFVVTKSVNQVGVNVNTASSSLLQYVSGCSTSIAKNIVAYREKNGKFLNREQIQSVPKLGPKTYTQAIGFLRILEGNQPLDQTAIHPESYDIALKVLNEVGLNERYLGTDELVDSLKKLDLEKLQVKFNTDQYTLEDVIECLKSPLRTPRDSYQTAILKQDILKIEDLKEGMELQGTVRNVVDFGAFVDIGLKNDGLVHISKMSNRRIKHPLEIVNVGDIINVWVDKVDLEKKKVALTMLKA
ncbi:MAG: RNA-binding transcriptional accessory protein [Erysipelotrichaceae bacterium]|nr:RNA-binding transcriptional accessory protein [Erysipelotrichaceae bacterium]